MCPADPTPHVRRGVMLLLVLSVLTLFLLLGTTMIVMATRARTAARAFMAATSDVEASPVVPRALLDELLLVLIRGSKDPAARNAVTESLLADQYEDGGNRVPYKDEPYDAFGGENSFLTDIAADGTVRRAAFERDGGGREVDNDADGAADGVWLDGLLPSMTASGGGRLSFRVSYLVRDLDGRINVNAHGGADDGDPIGPASIDGSALPAFAGNAWNLIQQGGPKQSPAPVGPVPVGRQSPILGRDIPGRGGKAYGLRLDRNAPRPASLSAGAGQNPFTPGELERVLRPFDPDWSTLPPRLSAILSDLGGSARHDVTTDSWDVTSKTGRAVDKPQPERRFDLSSYAGDKPGFAQAMFDAIRAAAGNGLETAQWVANVAEFRDPDSPASPLMIGGHSVTGVKPSILGPLGGSWKGGFVSSGDLVGIPKGDQTEIRAILNAPPEVQPPPRLESLVPRHPAILEAVGMPSPFAATVGQDPFREPGRVNVNTCREDVWRAVCGRADATLPQPRVFRTLWDPIASEAFTAAGEFTAPDVRALNREVANRLASVATVRSGVFAVWITLQVTDSSPTAGSPSCHRVFAIVDRSIPVEYVEGENKDVRQTIRVQRFLD